MNDIIRHNIRPQRYQLSVICPTQAVKAARREIRAAAQGHGLKVSSWNETLLVGECQASGAPANWMLATEFRSRGDASMHFLEAIMQRLGNLPLARVRLDILPGQVRPEWSAGVRPLAQP
ncbi:hypothetical protein HA052_03525 [Chromobacterium haemolyticum]|uniref:Uncharacterized protein n=1 Tax=Chromobacterium fluminis TaxID=3044269 RepID=A0ABX0L464_9NEIS|nr:hypothetical protein [Chromobacterium haemolyticum]NHR04259.1 hypothetical protein [Chromobacterium haemolyticum]OQS43880.1 hypothetical protein B0T39_02655 [Chromobacterium haemolyticum]